MKPPFKRTEDSTEFTKYVRYQIDGFWPTDTVRVSQRLSLDKEWGEPEIFWSTGGRDGSADNLQSAENFAAAILDAVKIAKLWKTPQ